MYYKIIYSTRVAREVAWHLSVMHHGRNVIVWGDCTLCDLIGYFNDSFGWLSRNLVILQVMFARYMEFSREIYGNG